MKGFTRLYQLWNGRENRISNRSFTTPTWKDRIKKKRENWKGILHARDTLSNYVDNGNRNSNQKGICILVLNFMEG